MKTIVNAFNAAFLIAAMLAMGCSKDKDKTPEVMDPDAVQVSLTKIYAPESGIMVNYVHVFFTMLGKTIYYGATSTTDDQPRFLAYDLNSNTFSGPLAVTEDLCACGYGGKLLNDGKNLFIFANYGAKYDVSANTWADASYPVSARDGEAGSTVFNGKIYVVGGRERQREFRYYDIAKDNWQGLPDYLYATSYSGLAGVDNKIYVLGGRTTEKKFSVFDLSSNTWQALPDLPVNITSMPTLTTVVVYKGLIWLLDTQYMRLYIYSPALEKWAAQPVDTGLDEASSVSLLTNGDKLYIAKAIMQSSTVELHEVNVM